MHVFSLFVVEFIGQTVQAQQTALLAMVVIFPYNLYGKSGEADPQTFLSPCILQYTMLPHCSAATTVVCQVTANTCT